MPEQKDSQNSSSMPTKSELEILQILWKHGPSTVRAVNNILNEQYREVYYTSTLKIMQLMVEKSLLKRNNDNVAHIYMPAVQELKTKGKLLDIFVTNIFEGSASKLVVQLLDNPNTSKDELEMIKKLLDDAEKHD